MLLQDCVWQKKYGTPARNGRRRSSALQQQQQQSSNNSKLSLLAPNLELHCRGGTFHKNMQAAAALLRSFASSPLLYNLANTTKTLSQFRWFSISACVSIFACLFLSDLSPVIEVYFDSYCCWTPILQNNSISFILENISGWISRWQMPIMCASSNTWRNLK